MKSKLLAKVVLGGILVLLPFCSIPGQETAARSIGVKVLLPQIENTFVGSKVAVIVNVNGAPVPGKGDTRDLTVTLPAGNKFFTVAAVWEPNNYTTITRKRTIAPPEGATVTVDLRKPDPKEKDQIVVRYVPTPQDVVDAMCKIAKVGPKDVIYDLGCGDGRIVITAVKKYKGKRGVGIDLDPERIKESKENADLQQVDDKVEFRVGDVLKIKDLPEATVVMLYMGDDINLRLRPLLKKALRPGARVVSHRFTMGDWRPDQTITVNSIAGYPCLVHLWEIKEEPK
jgi:predicted RNA methylase